MRRESRAAHADEPAGFDARKDLFGRGVGKRGQKGVLLRLIGDDHNILCRAAAPVGTRPDRPYGPCDAGMDIRGDGAGALCDQFAPSDGLSLLHDGFGRRARML